MKKLPKFKLGQVVYTVCDADCPAIRKEEIVGLTYIPEGNLWGYTFKSIPGRVWFEVMFYTNEEEAFCNLEEIIKNRESNEEKTTNMENAD